MRIASFLHQACQMEPIEFIKEIYRQLLNRVPDDEEISNGLNLLAEGRTKPELIHLIMTGEEAIALYNRKSVKDASPVVSKLGYLLDTDPETFVPLLYAEFLCRFAEDAEYDELLYFLRQGTPRISAIRSLLGSEEWSQLLASDKSVIDRKMLSIFLTSR